MKINSNNLEINGNKIWHEGNDGAGLDSDMVDGFHMSQIPTPNMLLPLDETGKFPEEVIPDSAISGSVDFTPIQDYNNSGNQGIYKTISFSVNDTKPGLMLLCKNILIHI